MCRGILSRIATISVVLSMLSLSAAKASAPDFLFRNITVENGLSSNTVRSMCQDSRGLMWFGTGEGLDSFDGREVMHHPITSDDRHNVTYINALYEDSDGRMWVGTDVGVYCRADMHGDFVRLDCKTPEGETLHSIVTHITQDRDGNIWFSTRGQGVFRYGVRDGALSRFGVDDTFDTVEYVYVDASNSVWVAAPFAEQPLYYFNKASDCLSGVQLTYSDCEPTRIQTILEDISGNLWFGTWDKGLYRCDRQSRIVTRYLAGESSYGFEHIHYMIESAPGELLVGSDDGMMWYNTITKEHRLYVNDRNDATTLSSKFVYPITKDAEGGIWVGTYYGGVCYSAPNCGQFERYSMSRLIDRDEESVVSCFCEDANGNVWVGSDNGGLMCFSPRTGRSLAHYLPQGRGSEGLSSHNIHALCADGNTLWIGTYAGGLNRLDMRTGKIRSYSSGTASTDLDNSSVYALCRDRGGRIWITTMTGVHIYDAADDDFIRVCTLGETTLDMEQAPDGDMWFATTGKGLFRYSPRNDTWRNYTAATDSLVCDYVNSIWISPAGDVWTGTAEGLSVYDASEDCLRTVDLGYDYNVTYVVGDGSYMWLTTTRGLIRYSPADGLCERYGSEDGLVGEQFMPNSGLLTSEGRIYVGCTSGFNVFFPHMIYNNRYIPPVVVTKFRARDRSRNAGQAGNLYEDIDFADGVSLSYRQNDIIVSYAALSYCAPEKNAYNYMLEGFDKQWRNAGNQTFASYTNLPAGRYRFRVMASNNDGVWNAAGTSLDIVVHPHFLLTNFAKVVYVLLSLAVLICAVMLFVRRSKRKYREQFDLLVQTRDAEEFGAKIQFMTMIAHEIRTPLSLIIAPLEKIMSQTEALPEKIREDVRVMDRNSKRLLQLINQLLDFRNMNPDGGMTLDISECNICALLTSICDRFMSTIEQRGLDFEFECPESGFIAMVDADAMTKVVSNLLSNAIKYTADKVSMICTVDFSEQSFTLRVSDNGSGLKSSDRKKIFVPFYRVDETKPGTGIGLTIVKHIVESHNGSITVNSVEGSGSEFVVTIPLAQPCVETPGDVTAAAKVSVPAANVPIVRDMAGDDRLTLLVVEDDADMLDFLVSSFSDKYHVFRASNGEEALEVLKRHNVTLIISDWMMPGISGADLCRRVRENQYLCHIPFILLTAKADFDSSLESLDCGADAHVKKPFSLEYLSAVVSHLIDMRNMLVNKFSIMPHMTQNKVSSNQADEDFFSRLNALIEANISNMDFSIDMLADKMCVSRSGLFSKVKTLAGVTPNKLILNARLKASASILLEGKYPVSVVSYMVGFNNPSYFSKCFVRQFGMSPHEWIESHTEKKGSAEASS